MVSSTEIKTMMVNNHKVFVKNRYEPNDIVWWVEDRKIVGRVLNVQGYYCHIVDEYGNEYYKSNLELCLDEANIIQNLMNDNIMLKKDVHNLYSSLRQLQRYIIPNYENTSFNIEPMRSKI
jgi:hypothetical protein